MKVLGSHFPGTILDSFDFPAGKVLDKFSVLFLPYFISKFKPLSVC